MLRQLFSSFSLQVLNASGARVHFYFSPRPEAGCPDSGQTPLCDTSGTFPIPARSDPACKTRPVKSFLTRPHHCRPRRPPHGASSPPRCGRACHARAKAGLRPAWHLAALQHLRQQLHCDHLSTLSRAQDHCTRANNAKSVGQRCHGGSQQIPTWRGRSDTTNTPALAGQGSRLALRQMRQLPSQGPHFCASYKKDAGSEY